MAQRAVTKDREIQNRKILEDINAQKRQLLLKQPTEAAPVYGVSPVPVVGQQPGVIGSDNHMLSTSQRTALTFANSNSSGWFLPQDSSFGNLILPVIPRLEKK